MTNILDEKYGLIQNEIINTLSKNPIDIVKSMMKKDFVSMHGPEHHYLDGASFLVAYKNSGGEIDLSSALVELRERAMKMPGAMCGQWGICGSIASIGAALSIIHKTGPLSSDDFYKQHMEYTSSVLALMSKIGGPRCCKRNAFLSIFEAAKYVKEKYGINMVINNIECEFSKLNQQCIKDRCPFYKRRW